MRTLVGYDQILVSVGVNCAEHLCVSSKYLHGVLLRSFSTIFYIGSLRTFTYAVCNHIFLLLAILLRVAKLS